MNVRKAARSEVEWMIRKHYLKSWPGVCVCILGLFDFADDAVGVIVFALPPRETEKRYGMRTWELARLWVSDDFPVNTESWFISRAVRHVKREHRDVGCLVSYADPSAGHQGTIYKAANWIEDGRTDEGRKTPRCDYWVGDKKYSRRSHIPIGAEFERRPRVSKPRFVYYMSDHEEKRQRSNALTAWRLGW